MNQELASLRRVFLHAFHAQDIASQLLSFDTETDVSRVDVPENTSVIGFRTGGRVTGYCLAGDIHSPVADCILQIPPDAIVPADERLVQVIRQFETHERLFVEQLGAIIGVITRDDLAKAPVRMWLFGFVTIVEMRWRNWIETTCENEEWRALVGEARIAMAEELLAERRRRKQNVTLLECLQFGDIGRIMIKNEALFSRTIFETKKKAKEAISLIQSLRNDLAHSQDIIEFDWVAISSLAKRIDEVFDRAK